MLHGLFPGQSIFSPDRALAHGTVTYAAKDCGSGAGRLSSQAVRLDGLMHSADGLFEGLAGATQPARSGEYGEQFPFAFPTTATERCTSSSLPLVSLTGPA